MEFIFTYGMQYDSNFSPTEIPNWPTTIELLFLSNSTWHPIIYDVPTHTHTHTHTDTHARAHTHAHTRMCLFLDSLFSSSKCSTYPHAEGIKVLITFMLCFKGAKPIPCSFFKISFQTALLAEPWKST